MMNLIIFTNLVILVYIVTLVIKVNLVIIVSMAKLVILMNQVILVNMVSLLIQVDSVILVFINLVNLWFDIKIYDLMFKCKGSLSPRKRMNFRKISERPLTCC